MSTPSAATSRMSLLALLPAVLAFALLAAYAGLAASRTSWLAWIEHATGDWRTALLSDRPATQHKGIAITDETLAPFPYRLPIDRGFLAHLVTTIDRAGATAIGLDFLFVRPTEPEKDALLVSAIRSARARVVVASGDARSELTPAQTAYQTDFIARSGARTGYANLLTGGDQIVRYLAPPADGSNLTTSFAEALAGRAIERRRLTRQGPLGVPLPLPTGGEPIRIAWLLKPKDGADTFPMLPAHALVTPAAAVLGRLLAGRIVIVGTTLPDVDRHLTPMPEWEGTEVAGVLLQGQVTAQIIDGRRLGHLPDGWLALLLCVLALPAVVVARRFGWRTISLFSGAATAAVVALDFAVFGLARYVIPFGACLVTLALGAAFGAGLDRALRALGWWRRPMVP